MATGTPPELRVSDELASLANEIGITRLEVAPSGPEGGAAGWWELLYVGLWAQGEPITPPLGEAEDTLEVDGVEVTPYQTEDGQMASFACGDQYFLTAVLGADDNVTGDPLKDYTTVVVEAAC